MTDQLKPNVDARDLRIGLVVSQYHPEITGALQQAAVEVFHRAGGLEQNLHIVTAPGAFELTALCRTLATLRTRTGRPVIDAAVALGCIITGETTHDQYIAQSVTQGLTAITVQTGLPIAFGVLTCQTHVQAEARSAAAVTTGGTNKGAEAMTAAIEIANTIRRVESSRSFR